MEHVIPSIFFFPEQIYKVYFYGGYWSLQMHFRKMTLFEWNIRESLEMIKVQTILCLCYHVQIETLYNLNMGTYNYQMLSYSLAFLIVTHVKRLYLSSFITRFLVLLLFFSLLITVFVLLNDLLSSLYWVTSVRRHSHSDLFENSHRAKKTTRINSKNFSRIIR